MVHRKEPEDKLQVYFVRLRNKTIYSVIFCYELFKSVSQYYGLIENEKIKPEMTLLEPRTIADVYIDCFVWFIQYIPLQPLLSHQIRWGESIVFC